MDDETSRVILKAKVQPAAVRPGETSIDCITRIAVENEPELVGTAWEWDVRNLNFYGRHLYLIDGQFRSASEEDIIMSMPLVRMELDIADIKLDEPKLQYVSLVAEDIHGDASQWKGAAFTDTTYAPPWVWHNPTDGPWLVANHDGYYSSGIEFKCDAARLASNQIWEDEKRTFYVANGTSLAHPGQTNHQVFTFSMAPEVESVTADPTFMFRPDAIGRISNWRDIMTRVAFHIEWRVKGETVGHTYDVTRTFKIKDDNKCEYDDRTDTYASGWPWRKFTLTGLDAEQDYEFDEFLMQVTFDAEIEHWNKENHATMS
jgi:hypothetical protein